MPQDSRYEELPVNPERYEDIPSAAPRGYTAPYKPIGKQTTNVLPNVWDTGIDLLKGTTHVADSAIGLLDLPTGGYAGKVLDYIGIRPQAARDILNTYQTEDLNIARSQFEGEATLAKKLAVLGRNPALAASGAFEALPSMVGGGGIGRLATRAIPKLAPRVAAALGEGILGTGMAAEGIRQQTPDKLLGVKETASAIGSGAVTGLTSVAMGRLADKLGFSDIDTLIATAKRNPAVAKNLAIEIAQTAGAGASEGVEEGIQSSSEQGFQNIALDRPITSGMAEAGAVGGITGVLMGGGGQIYSNATSAEPKKPRAPRKSKTAPVPPGQDPSSPAEIDLTIPTGTPPTAEPVVVPYGPNFGKTVDLLEAAGYTRTVPSNDGQFRMLPPVDTTTAPAAPITPVTAAPVSAQAPVTPETPVTPQVPPSAPPITPQRPLSPFGQSVEQMDEPDIQPPVQQDVLGDQPINVQEQLEIPGEVNLTQPVGQSDTPKIKEEEEFDPNYMHNIHQKPAIDLETEVNEFLAGDLSARDTKQKHDELQRKIVRAKLDASQKYQYQIYDYGVEEKLSKLLERLHAPFQVKRMEDEIKRDNKRTALDPKVAVIEDTKKKWSDLVGFPKEQEFWMVGIPVQSSKDGSWGLSHGPLTPDRQKDLDDRGIRTVLRSELDKNGEPLPKELELSEEQSATGNQDATFVTDEQGNRIETKEWTPEELAIRKKQIATDWYNARKRARELGINDKEKRYRKLENLQAAISIAEAEEEDKADAEAAASEPDLSPNADIIPGATIEEKLKNIKNMSPEEVLRTLKQVQEANQVLEETSEVKRARATYDKIANTQLANGRLLYDEGKRLTAEEHALFRDNPVVNGLANIFADIIKDLTAVMPSGELKGPAEHVGILISKGNGGFNYRRAGTNNSMILINFLEAMRTRSSKSGILASEYDILDPKQASDRIVHINLHEFTHLMARSEDAQFTWALSKTYAYFPLEKQREYSDRIRTVLTGGGTGYTTEVSRLLQIYSGSRGRAEVERDAISGSRLGDESEGLGPSPIRINNSANGAGVNLPRRITLRGLSARGITKADQDKIRQDALDLGYVSSGHADKSGHAIWEMPNEVEATKFREAWNLSRGLMSIDLPFLTSAAMRQGLPLIGPNFWGWAKAWRDSKNAYGSNLAWQEIKDTIGQGELFKRGEKWNPKTKRYDIVPSYAEKVKLALPDTADITKREEQIKSVWAERIPGYGRHVAASNRAYSAFLLSLRASSLTRFVNDMELQAKAQKDDALDPKKNIVLGRELAEAINTLSGRGSLAIDVTPGTKYTRARHYDFERAGKNLTDIIFSPRLQMSRIKMLNPSTYISASPYIRKLYIKGLLSAIGTWWAITSLLELAGWDVNKDPNSADFGKARLGDTRIDPGSGFQQYLVLGSRLRPEWFRNPVEVPFPPYGEMVEDPGGGKFSSSTAGTTKQLGEDPFTPDRFELGLEFGLSKLHPSAALIKDMLKARTDKPVFLGDSLIGMAVPMMTGDLIEVFQADPTLLPMVIGGSTVGLGGQTYQGGREKPVFTPALEELTGLPLTEWDYELGLKEF